MNKHIFSATILLLAFTACDDQLSSINENPNATVNPTPDYLLSAAEYYAANLYQGQTVNYNSTLLWVQHWSKIQYTEPDRYDVTNSDYNSPWNTTYATTLTDIDGILKSPLANDGIRAIAQVWRDWNFLLLTELYGDVPYTEYATSTSPAYDTQESILRALLTDLQSTEEALTKSGSDKITGDIIYGGNLTNWRKFARSLRLRIALLIADRDETLARQIISELYGQKNTLISSNAENARFVFDTSTSAYWNPWGSAFFSRDDQRVSKTLIDKLTALSDPRLAIYAQPATETGLYTGGQNGLTADAANNQGFSSLSKPGLSFLTYDAPATFFTYSEVLFIFAEAAARGFIQADASALYQEAIRASLEQYAVTNEDIEDYLSQPQVAFEAAPWYEQIGTQKWIASYGQAPDTFTDWRRLGYPQFTPGPNTALAPGELPRRFFYPSTEAGENRVSYEAAVAHQGADKLTTRLWFDVESKARR